MKCCCFYYGKLFAISTHILLDLHLCYFLLEPEFVYKLVEHFFFLNIYHTLYIFLFFYIYAGHFGGT
jgi:hypothetical protein